MMTSQRKTPNANALHLSRWTLLVSLLALATLAANQPGPAQALDSADKLKEMLKSTGFIEIKLLEAHVPDLDPLPLQKDSDVFVRVYLNDTKELVCETQVVQDENKPKFDKQCRTDKKVPSDTILRVELFDSDKPSPDPDWIGMTKIKVSDLIINRKLDSKESFPIEGRQFPKYFIKAEVDFKP